MKFKTTALLGVATVGLGLGVYFLDYKKQENAEKQKIVEAQIITFDPQQINLLELQKKTDKFVLQKNESGWNLLEPIQDWADTEKVDELIKTLADEKIIAIAKEAPQLTDGDLREFGLDVPLTTFSFKNNAGNSKKVAVGTQKNFEGNAFIRLDSENKVYVANSVWLQKAETALIYFREKRLYRHQLAKVTDLKVKSLQEEFALKKVGNKWTAVGHTFELDQNKVRELLKKISETGIQEYVFEGEPSSAMLKEKGLVKSPVQLALTAPGSTWSVQMNQSEAEKAIFALTDRPTSVVRLDITEWEFFGNMNLDSLRDRVSLTRFDLEEVRKIYYKVNNQEINFIKDGPRWKLVKAAAEGQEFDETELIKAINRLHDLEISEFLDRSTDSFKGSNMLILKTESDRLVYQLNWGPELKLKKQGIEKYFYYARTQIEPQIFALEKSKLEQLGFQRVIRAKTPESAVAPMPAAPTPPVPAAPPQKVESTQ